MKHLELSACIFIFQTLFAVLMSDLQTGQGARSQTKELGKTRADGQNQQQRTVMMNGAYDIQVCVAQKLQIKTFNKVMVIL